jgi:hypothetical protein
MPSISTRFNRFFLVLTASYVIFSGAAADIPSLSPDYYSWLGGQIFDKECNSKPSCLTHWNQGEDFPSMGIGHFIWYRQGQNAGFEETFPQLLAYLSNQGVALPEWIDEPLAAENPWPSREVFYADYDQKPMKEMRELLFATRDLQAAFIVDRFEETAQQIINSAAADQRTTVEKSLYEVANDSPPLGLYALIDYLHFKGSGLNPEERYQGQGWGLLQVLLEMSHSQQSETSSTATSLDAFVAAATTVLQRRVSNAPPARNEQRWLPGWTIRVQSYNSPESPPTLAR